MLTRVEHYGQQLEGPRFHLKSRGWLFDGRYSPQPLFLESAYPGVRGPVGPDGFCFVPANPVSGRAAATAALSSLQGRGSSESLGESSAQLAVKKHGRSELKEHESPESFREVGCPESFYSGTLAEQAVWGCGKCELKDREPPESFREVGCPEFF